jgi:hypothetical protein
MGTSKVIIHQTPHPLAGKEVVIKKGEWAGKTFRVEDYWDRAAGISWKNAEGNPACLIYAMRTGTQNFRVPMNDEVLYGKIGNSGNLIHVLELEE